jgi:catechol 2,3-dioxygenase-like lactoylglutathione lyase family enzyme
MLNDIDATAMIAVRDLDQARRFYTDVLGFDVRSDETGILSFRSGTTPVSLYASEFAGTNRANTLAWSVGDTFDDVVTELGERGVTFERYDLPGLALEGDVHVANGFKGVWFKDPDGNILHVNGS